MGVVFHKAEAARSLVESIQAHDQPLDLAAFREELVDLFFGRVEGSMYINFGTSQGGRECFGIQIADV